MSFNPEKLAAIAKPRSEAAIKESRFRMENHEWLRISQDIALALHYYLRKEGITQKALAERMDVSAVYVNKLLKGTENLTIETISKIQTAIGENIINVAQPYINRTIVFRSVEPKYGTEYVESDKYSMSKSRIDVYSGESDYSVA
jgi:transcriptional regulator with XRE-family HTH domain